MHRYAFAIIVVLVGISIFGLFIRLCMPASEQARCQECIRRMKQIGEALLQYHDVYKAFPPPYTANEKGERLHSWRVLILPYLPHDSRLDGIRLDEDWISEHNEGFYPLQPRVLSCPTCGDGGVVYKVIVGDKTAMGTSMSTWKRKPGEVVLLIEAWHPLPWMIPLDFLWEDFETAIYPNELKKYDPENGIETFRKRIPRLKGAVIGGEHPTEHHVLFADGTVKTYKDWKKPTVKELQAMCLTE
jgi:hypothetical protein